MNLLDETKGEISQSGHSTDDVRFVGSRDGKLGIPWSQAEQAFHIDLREPGRQTMSNPKMLVCNVSAHSMLRDGQKLLNVAFTDISFAAGYFDKTIGERRLTDIQLALNDVYEHYAAMTKAVERIRQIGEELIAEEIKEVEE